ncbi:hypothetical protein D3C78_1152770 [compost metagenome]
MRPFILSGILSLCIFSLTGTGYSASDTTRLPSLSASPVITPIAAIEAAIKPVQVKEPELQLDSINGISLYDSQDDVVRKLGEPVQVIQDPHLKDMSTYSYKGMNIVFRSDYIEVVEIVEGSDSLLIDGQRHEATLSHLTGLLGKPDYETEEGIVFERDDALLKLCIGPGSSELTYIHYFHPASM